MVLVDTSVWTSHFRDGNPQLEKLLNEGEVMCHPFVIGELACGNIKNRTEILSCLRLLPGAIHADHEEVLGFIENNRLMGRGIGYVDMHLASSAKLSAVMIWTLDKSLDEVNGELGVSYG